MRSPRSKARVYRGSHLIHDIRAAFFVVEATAPTNIGGSRQLQWLRLWGLNSEAKIPAPSLMSKVERAIVIASEARQSSHEMSA